MPAAHLCAITTCKGRLEHVKQTLPALSALRDCEIVVVDYDCPDGVGDWVRRAYPEVRVVQVADRPLFNISEARNLGAAAAAKSEWLMFVDADVMVAPELRDRIEPLMQPGVFLSPRPRPPELWGALVVAKADFDAIGGYDEAFEGWGWEDFDITERLRLSGLDERTFDGDLLTSLHHADADRIRFHAIADPVLNGRLNLVYLTVKNDLRRQGVRLDLAARRSLYADVRAMYTAPGGPKAIKVRFRQIRRSGLSLAANLVYEFDSGGEDAGT
jgi:glycosyltransferase involved in cell wall biosynthesis